MFMHARALMSARTVQSIPLSCLFISLLSENYYTKVKNVTYGAYERTWPFSYKIGHRKLGQTTNSWRRIKTFEESDRTEEGCPSPLQPISLEYFHTLCSLPYSTIKVCLLSPAGARYWYTNLVLYHASLFYSSISVSR